MQQANYEHLLKAVQHQVAVRNCEIEGDVFNLEDDIWNVCDLGLIDYQQAYTLVEMLKVTG